MKISEVRIYSEVLEQGLDFKEYILKTQKDMPLKNVYSKKLRGRFCEDDSIVDRLRRVKDIDVLITAVSDEKEYPLLMVEYSTAVPTDDHKMQRSDVYYWGAVFKTPMMKISPINKGMERKFGGGSKFTDELEIAMACKANAIYYPIKWENDGDKDILKVNDMRLSCIYYTKSIEDIVSNIFNKFNQVDDFDEYFELLKLEYIQSNTDIINKYTIQRMKSIFTKSSRFQWLDNKMMVKINRFGHAMDPDRGALYFMNMMLGAKNIITEIQVNRSIQYDCRGGYKVLFNALGCEKKLKEYVKKIIQTGNKFTDENAIYIFKNALCIDDTLIFEKKGEHQYTIRDDVLKMFLAKNSSMTSKCIFFLSTELRLTDKDRNIICTIDWNEKPIIDFMQNLCVKNFAPTELQIMSSNDIKEDVITFASAELYKRINCNLLAVSYPGAQGDRCVLTGNGRSVLRTYVDIIAYKNSENGIKVYLEECKDLFSKSKEDVEKLCEFKKSLEKQNGLKQLFHKILSVDNLSGLHTCVAAKQNYAIPNFDVDYIFMFNIDDDYKQGTKIDYTIAIIDTNLLQDFLNLQDGKGKLKGNILLDKIYYIQ